MTQPKLNTPTMRKILLLLCITLIGVASASAQMGAAKKVELIAKCSAKTTFSVQRGYNVINDYSLLTKLSGGTIASAQKVKSSSYDELHVTLTNGQKYVLNIYPYPSVTATTYSVTSPKESAGISFCTTVKEDGDDAVIEFACNGNFDKSKREEVKSFIVPLFQSILKGYKSLE